MVAALNPSPSPDPVAMTAVPESRPRKTAESADKRPLSLAFCVTAWMNGGHE